MKRTICRRLEQNNSQPPRRSFPFAKIFSASAVAASLVLPGCGLMRQEPMRLNPEAMMSIDADDLGFVKGRTEADDARKMMEARGLTGIVRESGVYMDKTLEVIASDYQPELHLFESGTYQRSIPLKTDGVPPYGFGLRLATSEGKTYLLALYRDPLDMVKSFDHGMPVEPPRIDIFQLTEDSFRRKGRLRLSKISKTHGGLNDPLFVGHNLEDGITLLARGSNGAIWGKAYHLKLVKNEDGRMRLRITGWDPLSVVAKCSCVQEYIYDNKRPE